jgi:hypothetical protein
LPSSAGGVKADDGEVEVLEGSLLGGEVTAGLYRAAEPGVQALDGVGRADDGPYFPVEGQERDELGPGVLPEPDDRRVLLLPRPAELGEPIQGSGFGRGRWRWSVIGRSVMKPPAADGVAVLPRYTASGPAGEATGP